MKAGERRVLRVWYGGMVSRTCPPLCYQVVPLYCFDPRLFKASKWGSLKTGCYRWRTAGEAG